MSNLYRCPMCNHVIETTKVATKETPILCPICLLENQHIESTALEPWIKMEEITKESEMKVV